MKIHHLGILINQSFRSRQSGCLLDQDVIRYNLTSVISRRIPIMIISDLNFLAGMARYSRITVFVIGLVLAAAVALPFSLVGAADLPRFLMTLPSEECLISPRNGWFPSEKWAWNQICRGLMADFNALEAQQLDPKTNPDHDSWKKSRRISRNFVRTILLYEPYRSAIPHRGVFIVGAYFHDGLDLNDATTDRRLVLERSLFPLPAALDRYTTSSYVRFSESSFQQPVVMVSAAIDGDLLLHNNHFYGLVELRGINVGGQLSLQYSEFHDYLNINSARVGGSVVMDFGRYCCLVHLGAASVGIQLSLEETLFEGPLEMNSIAVAESLLFGNKSQYHYVDLRGSDVGNQLSAVESHFMGQLNMNSITVGGDIIMRAGTTFSEVDLVGSVVNGSLSVTDSVFEGDLTMDSASIGGNLFMERAQFRQPIDLRFVQVGSNLDLRATQLTSVDLTSARITGDLRLGSSNVQDINWKHRKDESGSELPPAITLLNTSVGVLQDTKSTWPDSLEREFQGFTYEALGGFGAAAEDVAHIRESNWFIEWLDRDASFSPQPYRQLAQLLAETGHESMSVDVQYGSRVRERRELSLWNMRWWMLWALQITVGFGYGHWNFLALAWAAGFVVTGTAVLYKFVNGQDNFEVEKLGIWYCVDMLLPVIRLRERHYEIDLVGFARYYFFVHKIVGYLLTFFVIAGLSGLAE